jgi:GAF domain-containing protein
MSPMDPHPSADEGTTAVDPLPDDLDVSAEQLAETTGTLRRLVDTTINGNQTFAEKLIRVLEIGRSHLNVDHGFCAEVIIADNDNDDDDDDNGNGNDDGVETEAFFSTNADASDEGPLFSVIGASSETELFSTGFETTLENTYCREVFRSGEIASTTHASDERSWVSGCAFQEWGLESYIGTTVTVDGDPFGTVAFVDEQRREDEFTESERALVTLIGRWVGYELERLRDEIEIRNQRERLDAVNRHNAIAREITHTIIDAGDIETVERRVCDRLIAGIDNVDGWSLAWIGRPEHSQSQLESQSDTTEAVEIITPSYAAGDSGFLTDAVFPLSDQECVVAAAFRSREPQVVSNTETDPGVYLCREVLLDAGYQSMMAIPLVYNQFAYGVLCIHSVASDAFGAEEQKILSNLGEIVGHVIHSIGQERALRSESIVKVEFRNNRLGKPLTNVIAESGGDINPVFDVERMITTEEAIYMFTRGQNVSPALVRETAMGFGGVEDISVISPEDCDITDSEPRESCLFQIEHGERSFAALVLRHGGRLSQLRFDSKGITVTIELPASVDVRAISEEIRKMYAGTELLRKQTVTREHNPANLDSIADADLTDKQRTALETAYQVGYFDWPRGASGAEIAEILDISSTTFGQHLRAAQRKVFESLFDSETLDGAAK